MAGVSSLMATKSSGGYLEGRRLENKTRSAAPRANFRVWAQAVLTAAQQSPALHKCAILSVGGADRAHLDSGPPRLRRGDPMKRREFIRLVGGAELGPEGMMAYQETFVQRHQHRIYVRDHPGAEPAIILMHGFPDNVHLYDRLSPYLSPPRRVVLFDFLGWGSSDKPSGYPYTTDNQVGDLDAVITQLGLGQVVLVAHDASGPPAIDWALARPERVAGLVVEHVLLRNADPPAAGGDLALLHAGDQKRREACVADVRELALPPDVLVAGREVHPRCGCQT